MHYRKYEERDHAQLVELWNTVFPEDPPHNEPSKVIAEKLQVDDLIFVGEEEGTLVGACMAGYDGHRGWLYAVAVHPDNRRGGIGAALIHHTLDRLKSMGCQKVNLQIRSTNSEVEAFYRSLGFDSEDRLSLGIFLK